MRRRLRRVAGRLAAAAGVLTLALAGVALAVPAQASQASPATAAAATQPIAHSAQPVQAQPVKPALALPAPKGSRAACDAVPTGHMECMSLERTNVAHHKGVQRGAAASGIAGYGPANLQSAYRLPSGTAGSGETVAIVDAYDDPSAEADLQVYRAQYGLPVCDTANGCFKKVNQDGFASPLPAAAGNAGYDSYGWDVEESLDIDMVSAACPKCRILLVEANSSGNADLYAAEDAAVALGAKFVSNSWSGLEYPGEVGDDAYFNHPGVVITAAAGDFGYGAFYPAASRYVTSVGGTSLTKAPGTARGWTETVWSGTGSGCSAFEPKPSWQTDTGCANRTETDVSAVADPNTGVAIYDSFSAGGWGEVGGTSVATPLIAATYALGGPPAPGGNPASYPYAHPAALNDVTSGANLFPTCTPAYLCTAGPGYDGPTGLGTPNGVAAFSSGKPYGTVSGTVSAASGPLSGATVTAGGFTATTGPGGSYNLAVPAGGDTVSATAPGYRAATDSVQVTQGKTASAKFNLGKPAQTTYAVSGTVTDGSGHGWPLYATIRVSGYPTAFYTSPATGKYSISLPPGSYTLTVIPLYPGYRTATVPVKVGSSATSANIQVPANTSTSAAAGDTSACGAPGYAYKETGSTTTFTGWGTAPQDGWTVVNNLPGGNVWTFDNPDHIAADPAPGGDLDFATVATDYSSGGNTGANQDTSLVSPVTDLSAATTPLISFDSYFGAGYGESGSVDLSLDGGSTWTTVWEVTSEDGQPVAEDVTLPIPQAAGQSDVQVRLHFANPDGSQGAPEYDWDIDNVFIGNKSCSPVPGGLVTGHVTDHNTGSQLNNAVVTNDFTANQSGTSGPPWGAPTANGFYWLFSSPGTTVLTASDANNYLSSTKALNVTADAAIAENWSLEAGRLAPLAGSVSVTQALGGKGTGTLSFLDTGTQPVNVQLGDQTTGFTPVGSASAAAPATQAPLEKIKGHYSPAAALVPPKATAKSGTAVGGASSGGAASAAPATPSGTSWGALPDYPDQVYANMVGYDPGNGDMYSAGGADSNWYLTSAYVFSPARQQWSAIAPLPRALDSSAAAFIGGKFYVAGGATGTSGGSSASSTVYAYQPTKNTWSQVASLPVPVAGAESAVLNGALYVIGGCNDTATCSPASRATYRYSPSANKWTTLASLPQAAAFGACAGIDDEVVCAGGLNEDTGYSLTTTYIYHPSSNTWSQGATMPYDNWGMAYSGSGGKLQIASGVTDQNLELTNQAAQYDPVSNTWSALPNDNVAEYFGGSSCGLYQVGGILTNFDASGNELLSGSADTLPGYNQCGSAIPWLSTSSGTFTLQPGQTRNVTVTADSFVVSQPGTYTARLTVQTDTPYHVKPVAITMQVNPPSTWSEVTGTVTDASTGKPLPAATVQICANYNTSTGACGAVRYTLTTDSSGRYQLWLDRADDPLRIIADAPGYEPALKVATLVKGKPVTVSFALRPVPVPQHATDKKA